MSSPPVIGIVGFQASGKTEVASKLEELGASRVRMGDVVWKEVENRDLEITERNVGKVAKDLREEEGDGAVAKRCIPIIENERENENPVIVDGIRGISEVKKFKQRFEDDFFLISVKSSDETRYRRIKKRNREDDTVDTESFKRKDERENEWGLNKAIRASDYEIENEGSLSSLKNKTEAIFKEIISKYEN